MKESRAAHFLNAENAEIAEGMRSDLAVWRALSVPFAFSAFQPTFPSDLR